MLHKCAEVIEWVARLRFPRHVIRLTPHDARSAKLRPSTLARQNALLLQIKFLCNQR